ncbi:MAG TPA: calcium/proton exchanger [Chloroflexota bacterium]|jgi:Ca2+:H+ antiporter
MSDNTATVLHAQAAKPAGDVRHSLGVYVLLIAAPLALLARLLGLSSLLVFALAALGIIPLAALIGKATEELTVYLGPKLGGLLNATFDNVAELSITVISVAHGLTDFVKAAITGSIICNTLLCIGLAALIGGLRHGRLTFDREEAGRHAMLMLLAVAGLSLPSLFAVAVPSPLPVEAVSLLTAALLLLVYALYVVYTIVATNHPPDAEPGEPGGAGEVGGETTAATWSLRKAVGVLAAAVGAIVVVSELLVSTVEPVTQQLGWSELFVGIIIVPAIGAAAEMYSTVAFACKNRLDVSMAVAAGSSTQIALFLAPFLVLVSLLLRNPITLVFNRAELLVLGLTTAAFTLIGFDAKSNWLQGAQLLVLYLIMAVVFFFVPIAQ